MEEVEHSFMEANKLPWKCFTCMEVNFTFYFHDSGFTSKDAKVISMELVFTSFMEVFEVNTKREAVWWIPINTTVYHDEFTSSMEVTTRMEVNYFSYFYGSTQTAMDVNYTSMV